MANKHVNWLKQEMKGFVAFAEGFPEQYRLIILDYLCQAELKDDRVDAGSAGAHGDESLEEATESKAQEAPSKSWDFRREVFAVAKENGIELKKLSHQNFAALLGYVLKVRGPGDVNEIEVTPDLLVETGRAVARKQPADAAATLRTAKHHGILDRKKGQKGYTLGPAGENLILDLLAKQDES